MKQHVKGDHCSNRKTLSETSVLAVVCCKLIANIVVHPCSQSLLNEYEVFHTQNVKDIYKCNTALWIKTAFHLLNKKSGTISKKKNVLFLLLL